MIGIRIPGVDGSARRINDLYWRSDRTVGDITSELGVTRSALYAALEPLRTTRKCPECGGTLSYTTRTNRVSHTATCESCGTVAHLEESGNGARERTEDLRRIRRRWLPIPLRRLAMIGGAATLGAVLAAAAVRAVREEWMPR